MSTKSSLLRKWEQVWKKHQDEFTAYSSRWTHDGWREPFQLLGASLICTYNAMKIMSPGMLHKTVRSAIPNSQDVWKLLNGGVPDFRQNADKKFNELVSTMHMASSSFRLITALFLIVRGILDQAKVPLVELLKDFPDDWDRNKWKRYRDPAKQLKCCKTSKPLWDQADSEKIALAIIHDYRDEFGHGEQGRKERFESINKLHLCRIFEAQLLLAELGVDQLVKLK